MSAKATLETLARTMSTALLAFAVIGVGTLQATALETAPTPTTAPTQAPTEVVRKPQVRAASRSAAPASIDRRGVWLKRLLWEVGFRGKGLETAWAVAMRESSGRPTAHNDNPATRDNSYGLFQINMLGSLGDSRRSKYGLESNADLLNPVINARIAYRMTAKGKNWSAWDIDASGYNNGMGSASFRRWLDKYPRGYTWN